MKTGTIEVNDLVVIERAWPEQSKRYGRSVCCACWSPLHCRWFRLYPTPTEAPLTRWSVWSVRLRRNAQDSRAESWRIDCEGIDWPSAMQHVGEANRDAVTADLFRYAARDLDSLNACRQSLGSIRGIEPLRVETADRDGELESAMAADGLLFPAEAEHESPVRARLIWRDERQSWNRRLLSYGATILCNRPAYRDCPADALAGALQIGKPGLEHLLIAGNLQRAFTTYVVIGVLWRKIGIQGPSLFDLAQAG